MPDHLTTCEKAARAAGEVLMQWRGNFSVRKKGPADLVTETDHASQSTIQQILKAEFPLYRFVGEEVVPGGQRGAAEEGDYTWFVDPLDGTTNYVHGLPGWCVSIGLAHCEAVVSGCVYDPLSERCFLAGRGEGAYMNGSPLQVSGETQLVNSLVALSLPPQIQKNSPEIAQLLNVLVRVQGFRRLGSAALNLCHLAAGNLDGYWAGSIHPWDMAAGSLIVQEAGGVVTSLAGDSFDLHSGTLLAAATAEVHNALLQSLQSA